MNKRRDALRRGVRALIRDASRELAVLEGRPVPAEPDGAGSRAPAPRAPFPASVAPEAAEGRTAHEPSAPGSLWPGGPPVDAAPAAPSRPVDKPGLPHHASAPSADAQRDAPPLTPSSPAAGAPRRDPRAGLGAEAPEAQARQSPAVIDAPRPARPATPEPRREFVPPPSAYPPQATDAPPVAHPPQVEDPPKVAYAPKVVYPPRAAPAPKAARTGKGARASKTTRPTKTAHPTKAPHPSTATPSLRASASRSALRKARRSRPRLLPDIPVDGADPHQAFSRTGVCFAYFVNNACWRVRDAYCNTALHMCIIRNCPVYHLHKETLERRFARKFEHLW